MNKQLIVCVGLPRCGTTSLYDLLSRSDLISVSASKEIDYFSLNYDKGRSWFLSNYSDSKQDAIYIADISVNYCLNQIFYERIINDYPDCRILVCVRSPISFLKSMYGFAIRRGIDFATFEDFINAPLGSITGPLPGGADVYSGVKIIDLLDIRVVRDRVLNYFPSRNVLFLPLEILDLDQSDYVDRINDFLELEIPLTSDSVRHLNPAAVTRFNTLARVIPIVTYMLRKLRIGGVIGIVKRSPMIYSLLYKSSPITNSVISGEVENIDIDLVGLDDYKIMLASLQSVYINYLSSLTVNRS